MRDCNRDCDMLAQIVGETRKEFMKASINKKPQHIINKRYQEYVQASREYLGADICYDEGDRK